jgi:signal transduction histidine kinase
MHEQAFAKLDQEALFIASARNRLRWLRWCWLLLSLGLYAGWDILDQLVLIRLDPVLGGLIMDWGAIAALGVVVTEIVSRWEDRQLARIAELASANAAAERAALQLEAAQATARAVAHNLNQPLAAIRGYVELFQTTPAPERNENDLGRALAETDRAAEMVRRLLQITQYSTVPYAGGAPMFDFGSFSKD